MDIKEYISSGILELYVAGTLSEIENLEVYLNAEKYPEIKKEIEAIEASILSLSKSVSPGVKGFEAIKVKINGKNAGAPPLKQINWGAYFGWAASLIFMAGLMWVFQENRQLKSDIDQAAKEKVSLEEQIAESETSLEKTKILLETIRDKNITVVAMGGQIVAPNAYAKAYWNKKEQQVYIDAQGLPEPPEGMVYQVWSLKLDPLTPTSMGLLSDFTMDNNRVFALANPNDSEAFGITLEPAGGSESPNLDQLYALGVAVS
ncbi:anti-sigma factor [Arenibacter sp. 6A1]|uniref:anti-sigma factor n=1 Tax=Arenibacter sp. 6A1 TaxID=2720391 RepID=UPI001445377E|nr:anti-sigma factor [Arenibacter sp. 6A1]NKI27210.1 anti-sigma factor [Arenibacter sp. 6A1]